MNSLDRVLAYSKKYRKALILSFISAALYGIVSALPTYMLKHTVDEIFVKKYSHLVIPFILVFLVFFALKGLFMYLTTYSMQWLGNRVVNDMRQDLFSKIINFPTNFFQKNTSGKLMSYFLNDVTMIQQTSSIIIKDGISSIFEAIFLIGVAFYQNWILGVLMLVVGPLIGITIKKMGKKRKTASRAIQVHMGNISSMLQETFIGIREIKAFNAESIEIDRFNKQLDSNFLSIMHNVHIEALAPALIQIITMFGSGLVLYVAAHQVLNGSMSAGQLTSFVGAVLLAYQPLKKMMNVYSDMQYGLAAADRIFEVMDTSVIDPAQETKKIVLSSFKHEILWDTISFSYDNNHEVLCDTNFSIKKNECIGIVGPSGSGKSTVCDMLLGFIVPTNGTVSIDGHDITSISSASLREKIGYVGQRTFLFNDTIARNVAYAKPDATDEEIIRACKQAYAHDFIQNCSDGYQTLVGENGSLLSGGQKQRITIARALLKNPEILIFDEATSALDQESEQMIKLAIEEIRKEKTVIIVSHRPTMLENIDRLLVIQDKTVQEVSKTSLGTIFPAQEKYLQASH